MWSASIPSRATFSLAGMVELLGALRGDDLAVASARRAPWRGGGVRLPPRRSIPPARSGDLSRAWCSAPLSLAKRAKVIGEVVGVVTPTGTLAMFEALERAGSCPPCSSSGVMGWRSGRRLRCARPREQRRARRHGNPLRRWGRSGHPWPGVSGTGRALGALARSPCGAGRLDLVGKAWPSARLRALEHNRGTARRRSRRGRLDRGCHLYRGHAIKALELLIGASAWRG